ncbi:MAG: PilX N-terminal domain-containing pilus assembly protein [Nevskia sp.]|nr:PilX N-terminal domain-containing pilus assembly protein [Nevskia sp.]
MNTPIPTPRKSPQGGYALITAILFLVLLTLVALTSVKNSGLEARMGTNSTLHTQAFESSEITRHLIDKVLDANIATRGWPAQVGGTVNNGLYDSPTLKLLAGAASCPTTSTTYGFTLCQNSSGQLYNWYLANTECSGAGGCASFPNNLDQDASFSAPLSTSSSASTTNHISGTLSVYFLSTAPVPGQSANQFEPNVGINISGTYRYYYINGTGLDYTGSGNAADTSAVFRDVPRS